MMMTRKLGLKEEVFMIFNSFFSLLKTNKNKEPLTFFFFSTKKSYQVFQAENNFNYERGLTFELIPYTKAFPHQGRSVAQIPIIASIKTEEFDSNTTDVGLDSIFVIDKSGSMSGGKLTLVIKTLEMLIDTFTEKDRVSLVTFNNFGDRLCPLIKVKIKAWF